MSNDKDYRENFEQHRQEVELDDVKARRTRTRRNKKNEKQAKSPLLSILVFTFILIPLSILVYVWFLYEPEVETKIDKTVNNSPTVQIEKNEQAATAKNEEDKQSKDDAENNESNADNNQNGGNETGQNGTDVDVDDSEEAKIAAAAAEAEKKLKEQLAKEEAEKKAQAEKNAQPSAKTHIVQTGDTLYSISVKYYKNGSMVEKIKAANNLKSDSIPLGKELILP